MRATILSSIALALLALSGCASKPIPTGAFRGERPATGPLGPDPVANAQLRRVDLKIAEDGKATLEDGGIPWEGLLSRDGERLDFEVLAVAGVNIERQSSDLPRKLEMRVLPDGAIDYGGTKLLPVSL